MKTKFQQDPLDKKIDALLASRPLQASDDFTARVVAAAEQKSAQPAKLAKRSKLGKLIPFALPIAAAVAVAFTTWTQMQNTPNAMLEAAPLSMVEAEEIFLLEESLSALTSSDSSGLGSGSLLATLDALYLEI